ncbi:hypothetical protein M408DRAFT_107455 [Serendipita vermifera MAFF 305830]|uniref:Ubiquitin-like domain-containing protein n=1 Tax=Serendipita vermifera MAFF 305830 TaxID=933852 RepID=A0A0C2WUE4_SERVB|nr:hypothetical protein M408DRAFT_107455 [Serendipita vermifera MAFF 305830]
MAESEKKKRKRDTRESDATTGLTANVVEGPRITYHTPFKSFERVFNETSLDETKRVVRAKLGLEPAVDLQLAQLRGGHKIVLEDEDDFHAFRITLRTNPLVEVQVTIAGEQGDVPATKKRKTKASADPKPNTNSANTTSYPAITPFAGASAYATPSTLPNHSFAFPAFSTAPSFDGTVPPDSSTSIASSSHSKSTSPALPSPVLPFTLLPKVRTLPSATGVLGPTTGASALVAALRDASGSGELIQEKEKKEKPKRVRKKSVPAQSSVMSPAGAF